MVENPLPFSFDGALDWEAMDAESNPAPHAWAAP
jgi:hypothetical protein